MRPLKRPMFRTGGPIKEGVMNGLRDGGVATTMADATMMAGGGRVPFANGGAYVKNPDGTLRPSKGVFSSDFNKGVYNADGTPITIPKRNFFEDASFVLNPFTKLKVASMLTKGGIRGGKEAISGGLGSLKNFFKGPVPARKAGEVKNRLVTTEKAPFLSDKFFGQYIKGPLQSTKKAFTDAFGPAAGSIKDYKTAIALGIPTTGYGAYKMYQGYKDRQKGSDSNDPNDPNNPNNPNNIKGRNLNIQQSGGTKQGDLTKEELDKKKLDRIYKLLGVKKAQANAASKALIDMSRYIDEGGKDVISRKNIGSTISKAIGAFDKRLDKADQLKEAAGLMVAKGIVNEDDLTKKVQRAKLDQINRELNPTILDQKLALDLKGQTLTHDRAATIAKRSFPNTVVLADAKKAKDEGIGKEKTVVEYVAEQIKTQGGDVAGVYVVDKSIVQVDTQGNIKQII